MEGVNETEQREMFFPPQSGRRQRSSLTVTRADNSFMMEFQKGKRTVARDQQGCSIQQSDFLHSISSPGECWGVSWIQGRGSGKHFIAIQAFLEVLEDPSREENPLAQKMKKLLKSRVLEKPFYTGELMWDSGIKTFNVLGQTVLYIIHTFLPEMELVLSLFLCLLLRLKNRISSVPLFPGPGSDHFWGARKHPDFYVHSEIKPALCFPAAVPT